MDLINRLKKELSVIRTSEIQCYFEHIADLLMNHCVISKDKESYEIVDIEFYLFTPEHQDVITYPREISSGYWFFHPSGVDLSIESNSHTFGGILIRGIRNVKDGNDQVLGPQKCVEVLWDKFEAFDIPSDFKYPLITAADKLRSYKISSYPRWISVPKGKTEIEKIKEWKKRLPENTPLSEVSDEDLAKLVFQSEYRFVKMNSIDQSSDNWKKYTAKPKKG